MGTYYKAKEIFDDISNSVDPTSDPIMYNLGAGLAELAEALDQDMHSIKQILEEILVETKRRR